MIKHCVSETCCKYWSGRQFKHRTKVEKEVEENVSTCPDCGDTLVLLKQHRKSGYSHLKKREYAE